MTDITPSPFKKQRTETKSVESKSIKTKSIESKLDRTSSVPVEVYRAHVFSLMKPGDIENYAQTSKKSMADAQLTITQLDECEHKLDLLSEDVKDQADNFTDLNGFIQAVFDLDCSRYFDRVRLIFDAIEEHHTHDKDDVIFDPIFLARATINDWINYSNIQRIHLDTLSEILIKSSLSNQDQVLFIGHLVRKNNLDLFGEDMDQKEYEEILNAKVLPVLFNLPKKEQPQFLVRQQSSLYELFQFQKHQTMKRPKDANDVILERRTKTSIARLQHVIKLLQKKLSK